MKKFVIHSTRGKTSVMEVECEKLSRMDHFHMGLKEGEWMGKITAPQSLFEKTLDGKLVPPVWCWWAFYETAEEYLASIKKSAVATILRTKAKRKSSEPDLVVEVTEEELSEISSNKIEVVML